MKISPVTTAGSVPSADVGAVSTQRTSPDRIAAAKAAFNGEVPVKITQSDTPVDPEIERMKQNIRSLKMRTNVSPDRITESITEPIVAETTTAPVTQDQNNAISTNSETQDPGATKPLSPQFAALAKQRRALQQERAALEQEKARLTQLSTDGNSIKLDQIKSDPLSVLEKAGVTYEQLTEAILSGQSNPASQHIRALEAKIQALEQGLDSKFTERDQQAEQQVVSEIRREAAQLVATGDEFKYTRAMRKAPDAARLVHEHWKQTGEVWDTHYALGLIEAECKKEYEALTSQLTPAQKAEIQQQAERPQGMRTLTNKDTARPNMSRRERMLAAFNGTLKK